MTAKVKSVLTVAAEALEIAAGYALVAVGIYAALFVDLTGGGSLWNTMHHLQDASREESASPNATRVIKVPAQPAVAKIQEDRMLAVFSEPAPAGESVAVYQAPDAAGPRPSAAFTDTPADPKSGKTWKRGLQGELRNFTIYGKGDQTASAAVSGGGAPAPGASAVVRAVVSAGGSPAGAETAAEARPGVGSRLSRGALSASGASRNVR